MNTEQALMQRSDSCCELCASHEYFAVSAVSPYDEGNPEHCVTTCAQSLRTSAVVSIAETPWG